MVAMPFVTLPTMLLTWITILVMLAFVEKPRELLVLEGKQITRDIAPFSLKIMLEGNLIAASCALLIFLLFIHKHD
ncbi:hypothetical protein SUGI_0151310 [Cryptomeria japonica]|nr:hypothetical protein SUGI_0151310 [Cryptomeria japonica]